MAENTAYPTDDHIEAGVGQADAEEAEPVEETTEPEEGEGVPA